MPFAVLPTKLFVAVWLRNLSHLTDMRRETNRNVLCYLSIYWIKTKLLLQEVLERLHQPLCSSLHNARGIPANYTSGTRNTKQLPTNISNTHQCLCTQNCRRLVQTWALFMLRLDPAHLLCVLSNGKNFATTYLRNECVLGKTATNY
jgi:hypothetical protein